MGRGVWVEVWHDSKSLEKGLSSTLPTPLPVVDRVLGRVEIFLCGLVLVDRREVGAPSRHSHSEVSVFSEVCSWSLHGPEALRLHPLTISERSRDARCPADKESSSCGVCCCCCCCCCFCCCCCCCCCCCLKSLFSRWPEANKRL